ncbi:hypothetical protein BKA69DRAFT_36994 [Paraphysoderma sedebokerense]|nr:hypothetical protein BKA69DRAFT_36994 [Paraphysoderma sedebokerense]
MATLHRYAQIELGQLHDQLAVMKEVLNKKQQEMAACTSQIDMLNRTIKNQATELKKRQIRIDMYLDDIQKVEREKGEIGYKKDKEIRVLMAKVEALEKNVAELNKEKAKLKQRENELLAKTAKKKAQLESENAKLAAERDELATRLHELNAESQRINELNDLKEQRKRKLNDCDGNPEDEVFTQDSNSYTIVRNGHQARNVKHTRVNPFAMSARTEQSGTIVMSDSGSEDEKEEDRELYSWSSNRPAEKEIRPGGGLIGNRHRMGMKTLNAATDRFKVDGAGGVTKTIGVNLPAGMKNKLTAKTHLKSTSISMKKVDIKKQSSLDLFIRRQ